MNKKPNYVDCTRCAHWSEDTRRTIVCEQCNNTLKTPDPKDILCNLCGECTRPLGAMNEQYPHGLENAKVAGGYDSYHLFDCTSYTFSFCEKCLRELFTKCKIPPSVYCQLDEIDNPTNYARDLEDYEYRLWKDNGGHHQAYLDKKCNFVKDCPNKAVYTQFISGDFTENCSCEEHKELWGYGNSKLTKFIQNILKPFL